MEHFIFAPPVKTDTITCMSIMHWLQLEAKKTTLVIKKGYSEFYESVNIPYISESDFRKKPIEGEISIYFLHATSFYQYFKTNLSILLNNKNITKINLNFFPEGFGNAMWGEKFTDRIEKDFEIVDKIHLDKIISYGFKQNYIDKKFPTAKKLIINYEHIISAMESNKILMEIVSKALNSLDLKKELIIIPFRPWCTKSFHGGMYNFGSRDEFNELVVQLLSRIEINPKSKILFRSDSRYKKESSYLFDFLSETFDTQEITDDIFPSWVSLEPLFHGIINNKKVESVKVINFDSTTSIPLVFQSALSSINSLLISFGCPKSILSGIKGGEDFYDRKLRSKIKMFTEHMSPLSFENKKVNIKSNEAGDMMLSLLNK
jgi:hypothetical protein